MSIYFAKYICTSHDKLSFIKKEIFEYAKQCIEIGVRQWWVHAHKSNPTRKFLYVAGTEFKNSLIVNFRL